jgi:hypothetical protein
MRTAIRRAGNLLSVAFGLYREMVFSAFSLVPRGA